MFSTGSLPGLRDQAEGCRRINVLPLLIDPQRLKVLIVNKKPKEEKPALVAVCVGQLPWECTLGQKTLANQPDGVNRDILPLTLFDVTSLCPIIKFKCMLLKKIFIMIHKSQVSISFCYYEELTWQVESMNFFLKQGYCEDYMLLLYKVVRVTITMAGGQVLKSPILFIAEFQHSFKITHLKL